MWGSGGGTISTIFQSVETFKLGWKPLSTPVPSPFKILHNPCFLIGKTKQNKNIKPSNETQHNNLRRNIYLCYFWISQSNTWLVKCFSCWGSNFLHSGIWDLDLQILPRPLCPLGWYPKASNSLWDNWKGIDTLRGTLIPLTQSYEKRHRSWVPAWKL